MARGGRKPYACTARKPKGTAATPNTPVAGPKADRGLAVQRLSGRGQMFFHAVQYGLGKEGES